MDIIKNEQFLNKVLHGDCLEWMPQIEDKSIDMILCDLPYGTTACKWDSIIPFDMLWEQYMRIIKDNGAIVLTSSQPFTTTLAYSNLELLKYSWVWEKTMATGGLMAKKRPMKAHEDILVFYKKQPTYNPQMLDGEPYTRKEGTKKDSVIGDKEGGYVTVSDGGRYPRSVLKIANPNRHNQHPTQKPIDLMEYLIKTYTSEGETVLDNCLGSGTTAVAAINTNRNFIGIEQEWDYCEIANERIKKALESKV